MKPVRIAIFASGRGSNALSLIKKSQTLSGGLIEVAFVMSDQPGAGVIERARQAGIKTFVIPRLEGKQKHEEQILLLLAEYRIDWIFLAGYMRLLSSSFIRKFTQWHGGASQIVNIHPSLLPAYPGVDSIKRAFTDSVPMSGVTLHFVDEGMDTGKIIYQESIVRNPEDSLEGWSEQFHLVEHRLYAQFMEDIAHSKIVTIFFEENS